jgi:histidine triad (HIT) family protein
MEDCIFCKIGAGIIQSDKVYEDNMVFAFRDMHPQAPTHILIIPKQHFKNLAEIDAANQPLMCYLFHTADKLAKMENILDKGYRVVVNCGQEGGQVMQHLHLHLLGGRMLEGELG